MLLKMRFALCELAFDPAEVHRAYTQVGGDIVLGNPLYDVGSFLMQVLIALFWRIPDGRDEFIHIMHLPGGGHLEQHPDEIGFMAEFIQQLQDVFFFQQVNDGGLYSFDRQRAGDVVDKAVERTKALVFKKELYGFFSIALAEKHPYAPLLDEDVVLGTFTFFQQDRFRGDFHPFL